MPDQPCHLQPPLQGAPMANDSPDSPEKPSFLYSVSYTAMMDTSLPHKQKAACPPASALDQLQGDLHHTGLLQPAHQLSLGLLSLHQPRLQRGLQLLVQDAEHGDGRHLPSSQAEGSMLHSLGSGACSRKAFVTRPANT